jgi:hypothetical protein
MEPSEEEYATAFHEAAHAVIALELGVPVEYATIEPCGSTKGEVKTGEATAEQEAMITMAGPMADAKFAGVDYDMDWVRKYNEVWEHLLAVAEERGIAFDPEDPAEQRVQLKALHDELASEVRRLFKKRLASIHAVAEALITHRTLDATAIQRIAYGSPTGAAHRLRRHAHTE